MSAFALRARRASRGLLLVCLLASCGLAHAQSSQPGTVDLAGTPPDLKTSVDPNIVVTFDDSGSMVMNTMGDDAPFLSNGTWSGPWRCAGVIDPRIDSSSTSLSAEQHARISVMNGVYYNPNVSYTPPLKSDGTPFPNADASLTSVWRDGIAVNRPDNPVIPLLTTFANNPNSGNNADDSGRTNLMGTRACLLANTNGTCRTWAVDTRWQCGWSSNPVAVSGGPYYYRLINGINIVNANGTINTTALYTAANWEFVAVPADQYQNFANWYAYYRTRTLMTRSAMARVFGAMGGNIRVAWQNLNDVSYRLPASTIITALNDDGSGVAANYRSKFFDWLYQVPAANNTPNRAATIRAGNFFSRTGTDLKNPYWQPGSGSAPGRELSCRQNYHMLVTDGFWNEGSPGGTYTSRATLTLPDGKIYNPAAASSQIFTGPISTNNSGPTLADIAFHFWSRDLRSNLANNVIPYITNRTTGITGNTPLEPGQAPIDNEEIYFNPANDPATWQHVVQFMVTLGITGQLRFSDDFDCADSSTDLCKLRKGLVNSTGAVGWPAPVNADLPALDDTWHAALNGRGAFFNASDPSALVTYMTNILTSIMARRGTSTAVAVTLPILTSGTSGYRAGYDSSDWSGFMHRVAIDAVTGEPGNVLWDAGCKLTGGACPATGSVVPAARDPSTRIILTSDGQPGTGRPFRWGSLGADQQARLNLSPNNQIVPATWTSDGHGEKRLDYLRGDRTYELAGSVPRLRQRGSVLGAVINAQPEYVSAPNGGFSDNYPLGTREEVAARAANGGYSYAKFQYDNRNRPPSVYVAANDGMLHAFNAVNGDERWAYVPNILFGNDKLVRYTSPQWALVNSVDDRPVVQDVCIGGSDSSGCRWKTLLVGSLRLGGRGIYALDISSPATVTESSASVPLWEFSQTPPASDAGTDCAAGARFCSSLGYTFDAVNIARLNNGRWVALVSSSYFPKLLANCTPADCDTSASGDPAANRTSLLVIDIETGRLIREIRTSAAAQPAVTSYGLSKAVVYDLGSNQIDDLAIAGDLAGNLWRFDLSNADPTLWRVDRIFSNFGGGGAAAAGDQPISVMPVPLTDPLTRGPIYIFGTGKFLGDVDRVSAITTQSFYGIRDYGTASANYPITVNQLTALTLTQTADGVRSINKASTINIPATQRGWRIPLNIASEPGERNVVAATPLYSSNQVILTTLVPVGDDPCSPGRRGAIMVVDAGTGGAPAGVPPVTGGTGAPANSAPVGMVLSSEAIPSVGSLPLLIRPGGGSSVIPGIPNIAPAVNFWNRSAWRELLDLL